MNPFLKWVLPLQILAFSLLASLSGCGEGGKNVGNGIDSVATFDTLDPAALVRSLTLRLKRSPKDYELWYKRSKAWYDLGNTAQAIADCDKAIELNVTYPEAYHLRGFYYYAQNNDSAALRDLDRAAQTGSVNPETFYMVGQIFFMRKDYPEALKGYNNAISLDSLAPTYYFARGLLYQAQQKTDKAIEEYRHSLDLDPGFIKVLLVLHDIYLNEKKDPDQAYVFNDRILKVDSLHPLGRYNQGNFFLARANNLTDDEDLVNFQVLLKLAVSEYGMCLQKDGNFALAYYNRGYCHYLLEDYRRAISDFDEVIRIDPFNEKAFFMKASIQEFEGDLNSALANYEQALKINPSFFDAKKAVNELKTKTKVKLDAGNGK